MAQPVIGEKIQTQKSLHEHECGFCQNKVYMSNHDWKQFEDFGADCIVCDQDCYDRIKEKQYGEVE